MVYKNGWPNRSIEGGNPAVAVKVYVFNLRKELIRTYNSWKECSESYGKSSSFFKYYIKNGKPCNGQYFATTDKYHNKIHIQ